MKINDVEEPIIAVRRSQYPTDNKPEFLLLGRSNVGKSSFTNSIMERRNLARISSKPGKTQTINFYKVNVSKPTNSTLLYLHFYPFYLFLLTS